MNCKILRLKNRIEWNSYLRLLPLNQQDIYYTPEYYSLYENYGDGEAQCFVFESRGEIALYPFLLNSVNKLGYSLNAEYYDIQGAYGYNGVVSSNTSSDFTNSFHFHFNKFCIENNIIAEFTRFHPLIMNHDFSRGNSDILFDRNTVYVNLSKSINEIILDYKKSTRQEYRWTKNKYCLQIKTFKNDLSPLDDFIKIYSETMNRVNAIDYLHFSREYFINLINRTNSAIFFAYDKNEPIAAGITFISDSYLQGHLGGTLTDYLYMSPNSLLYTEMIKFGQKNGCKYFHIGGGNTNDNNDPLLKYKMNFSKTTTNFYIGKKVYNPAIYEDIVQQWKSKFPESYNENQNMLLGYREIKNGF